MNILLTENQLIRLNESSSNYKNLCNTIKEYPTFCSKVEKVLKDGRTGGREGNLVNLSSNFFSKVVRNPTFFKTITLSPGNPEFDKRMESLLKLQLILSEFESCPEVQNKVEKDIKVLPEKGLEMVVDEDNKYSLLNRLETHWSAKAYLLTKIILDELSGYENETKSEKIDLNNVSDEKIREIIKYVIDDDNIDTVSEYLSVLLNENQDFRNYFMGSIEYSRKKGNEVEQDVFNLLRKKYGEKNVIEFSEDFGFVDYFGIDGVIIQDGFAQPIQISSSMKHSPEIFTYSSDSCKPLGFFKSGNKIIKYQPI